MIIVVNIYMTLEEFVDSDIEYIKTSQYAAKKCRTPNDIFYIKVQQYKHSGGFIKGRRYKVSVFIHKIYTETEFDDDFTQYFWYLMLLHGRLKYNTNPLTATRNLCLYSHKLNGCEYAAVDITDGLNIGFDSEEDAIFYKMKEGCEITNLENITEPSEWNGMKIIPPFVVNYPLT